MGYMDVFGGTTIYPSDVSLLALTLVADVQLEWPLEASGLDTPLARIVDVTPDVSGHLIVLPAADAAAPGQTVLFNNLSTSASFTVTDFFGTVVATVPPGTVWQVYLADNTTPAGVWYCFQFGASTATVQPSALAGFGLTVTNTTLSAAVPVLTFSTTGLVVSLSNRATAFVWKGTGAGVLNLLATATAGNNFIFHVRNEGGGSLTIDPSGAEVINDGASLILQPGDSASVFTDGISWYTVGLGQSPVFAFDYTSIALTGGTYTLAGSELNRIAYKFTGALTSNATVVVPATVQQYWIDNTTTGSFLLYVQAVGGTPVQVNQGAKGIYYCDGTNMILASDPISIGVPVVISAGGTGAITASAARLNLGISTFADPIVTAVDAATVRNVAVAAKSGDNADITSLSVLTGLGPLTGNYILELAGSRTDSALTGIDFHASPGTDFDARIMREAGVNGILDVVQSGSGNISFQIAGAERFRVQPDGSAVASGPLYGAGLFSSGNAEIRNTAPVLNLRNTGARTAFLHTNTNTFYILSGVADSTTWTQVGGAWPLQIDLTTNNATFGNVVSAVQFNGSGAGLTGSAPSLTAGAATNANHATSADSATNASHATSIGGGNFDSSITSLSDVYLYINGNGGHILNGGGLFRVYDGPRGGDMINCPQGGRVAIGNIGNNGLQVYGNLDATGNVSAFSDRRLKTDLKQIEHALDKVEALTGYTFTRTDLYQRHTGLIAQDVENVLPEAVSEGEGGMLALNYGAMMGLIVEALKELRREVGILQAMTL
jgi:hypothetical protein